MNAPPVQREFPSAPLVGVGGVVIDSHGRVLLVQRGSEPLKGRWSIPGGLVELGELLSDAVIREIAEETGLLVKPQAIVEVVDRVHLDKDSSKVRWHYVIVDYWCSIQSGEARPLSDAAATAWATRTEWTETNPYALEPITMQVIEKAWQLAHKATDASHPT